MSSKSSKNRDVVKIVKSCGLRISPGRQLIARHSTVQQAGGRVGVRAVVETHFESAP